MKNILIKRFYSEIKKNQGVIESIQDDGDIEGPIISVKCTNTGTVDISACVGFEPKVGDPVQLWIASDPDIGGWYLTKGHTDKETMEIALRFFHPDSCARLVEENKE